MSGARRTLMPSAPHRQSLDGSAASGHFCLDEASEMAETLIVATNAYLPYSLSVRELGSPDTIRENLSNLVDLLIRGLTRPKTL